MRLNETIHFQSEELGAGQIAVRAWLQERALSFGEFRLNIHKTFPDLPLANMRVDVDKLFLNENGEEDGFTLGLAAGELIRLLIEDLKLPVDAIAGVPTGATILAKEMAKHRKLSGVTVVPVTKGKLQEIPQVEGRPRVVVIEDVLTTATSSLELVQALLVAGYEVVAVIALVDRDQWGRERLEELGGSRTSCAYPRASYARPANVCSRYGRRAGDEEVTCSSVWL